MEETELKIMNDIWRTLETLPYMTRSRIIQWLVSKSNDHYDRKNFSGSLKQETPLLEAK